MSNPSPKIDTRTAAKIAEQVIDLLAGKNDAPGYAPAWREYETLASGERRATGVSGALIGVFARFAEIIIQRLNQAPQKNFLAFLDLLGAAPPPPQPARVPLTFSLAAGSAVDGLVPAGTQVAAPPSEGEKEPVIFETERELTVTAAQLVSIFTRDPVQDKYADHSAIIAADAPGERVFHGAQPIEHILYLGHSGLLGFPKIDSLRLLFTLEAADQDARKLSWELWDGSEWKPVGPVEDEMQNLSGSGNIALGGAPLIPELSVNAIRNRWLRGRLLTPITITDDARPDMVRATQLPKVRQVLLEAHLLRAPGQGLSPEAAFTNAAPVELGKDFFPFGEKPKLNDALYLASAEAFSKDRAKGLAPTGATVQLDVQVTNSHLASTTTSMRPSADLQLAWECWNGKAWERVGVSDSPKWLRLLEVEQSPEVTAEERVTVQGRAQKGAVVRHKVVKLPPQEEATVAVNVGEDGRFATSVPLEEGLNMIEFTASLGSNTDIAWVTFFREAGQNARKVVLTVQPPLAPVSTGSINLVVNAIGPQADDVDIIQITNGSNNSQLVTGLKGRPLPIDLIEGRNELLIKGLSRAQLPLAATTLTISREAPKQPPPGAVFFDGTHAFCQSGIVWLTLPDLVAPVTVNGQENFWLRVRVISGDYGKDASYKLKKPEDPNEGFTLVLESFRPPMLSSVKIGYEQTLIGAPEVMLAYNNSTFASGANATQSSDPSFEPFVRAPEDRPTLYIGFALPTNRTVFPNRTISLYAGVEELRYAVRTVPTAPESSEKFGVPAGEGPRLAWEYWNGEWAALTVRDDTDNFTRQGLIEFLAPPDFTTRQEFGQPPRYWLRVRWEKGEYANAPILRRMPLNTTMAAQTVTLRNEVLGSSDGSVGQRFRATRAPILAGQRLEVREPEMPSAAEQEVVTREEGADAITLIRDAAGRPEEVWVRWREAQDFYDSGPRSRYYVLDHLTGEIRFGDGLHGLIPPAGAGNIRLARYQVGGGKAGNKPAGAIIQLKTTAPYVDKVINHETAAGGADAEMLGSLIERAPRTIRHRGRAVTAEDYEDMAMLASPEVARAKCVPNRNLFDNPFDEQPPTLGDVSVIVVPHSLEAKPQASLELLKRVLDYLKARSVATSSVFVVGPLYLRVDVRAEIALASLEGASAVEQAVHQTLAVFLHPLTGGPDQKGWEFGREPHKSDLYALIEATPGVDHIRTLNLEIEDEPRVRRTGRFLVHSGAPKISLVFESL